MEITFMDPFFQLSCEALGSPDPRMEWLKDGQVVQDESPNKLEGHSSVLDLSFLSASDSGSYTCRASNLIGQVKAEQRRTNIMKKIQQ